MSDTIELPETDTTTRSKLVDALVDLMPQFFDSAIDDKAEPRSDGLELITDSPVAVHLPTDEKQKEFIDLLQQRKALLERLKPLETPPPVAGKAQRERIATLIQQARTDGNDATPAALAQMSKRVDEIVVQHQLAIDSFERAKHARIDELAEALPIKDPVLDTATDEEASELAKRRSTLTDAIADPAATLDELEAIEPTIATLADDTEALRSTVAARYEARDEIARGAKAQIESLLPEAPPGSAQTEHEAVLVKLEPRLTDEALSEARDALRLLTGAASDINIDVSTQKLKQEQYALQLGRLATDAERPAVKSNTKVQDALKTCTDLLPPVGLFDADTRDRLARFPAALKSAQDLLMKSETDLLAKGVDRGPLRAFVGVMVKSLQEELLRVAKLSGVDSKQVDTQTRAIKALQTRLTEKGGTMEDLQKEYLQKLKGIQDGINLIRDGAVVAEVKVRQDRDRILARVDIPDPPGIADDHAKNLAALRKDTHTLIDGEFDQQAVSTATKIADRFKTAWTAAQTDAVHRPEVARLWQEVNDTWNTLAEGARTPVQQELTQAIKAATPLATDTKITRNMQQARTRLEQIQSRLQEVTAEAAAATRSKQGLTSLKIGTDDVTADTAGKLYDRLGPKALDLLTQQPDGPALLSSLCEAYRDTGDKQALDDLLGTGLRGNAAAITGALRSGDTKALLQLATAFGGEGNKKACAQLGNLVDKGGLADKPNVLTDVIGFGVDNADDPTAARGKNLSKLKDLCATFGEGGSPAQLKKLLVDAGLGTTPTAAKPGAFAEMLFNGGDNATPAKMLSFANGLDGKGAAQVKAVMTSGGLAEHPKTLGPLAKTAGVGVLGRMGDTFNDTASRGNLDTILRSGGLSGETGTVATKHEHPDTLAKLFNEGLGGNMTNLKEYAAAFALAPQESKMMLDAFNEMPDAKDRKPGAGIKKVLAKLGGDVGKLQTTFTTEVGKVTPARRAPAIRFAPHFDEKPTSDNFFGVSDEMTNLGVKTVTGSVLRRHTPEHFDKDKMGTATLHSQFPPGTNVAALIKKAFKTFTTGVPDDKVKLNVDGFLVEIGFLNPEMCNHFTPWTGSLTQAEINSGLVRNVAPPDPKETPGFTTSDINHILDAIK